MLFNFFDRLPASFLYTHYLFSFMLHILDVQVN